MIKRLASSILPTEFGKFNISSFAQNTEDPLPTIVIESTNLSDLKSKPYVRLHSECITSEVFGSLRCDCNEQLMEGMQLIHKNGGILIYLRQEGRGIGFSNKIKAYELQDQGFNTVDANIHLGFNPDQRNYDLALEVLKLYEFNEIKLITNNPLKYNFLSDNGIKIIERIPLIISPNEINRKYLLDKKDLMNHII